MPQPGPADTRDIQALLAIMARLRAPDGCPWDRKQTHASILSHLIEEAYEFVDAVEAGDTANMKEELGDLLLQVVFQAQMAQEAGTFAFPDVVEAISEKLVRRHPHVFGESTVDTAEGVQQQWDEIKKAEKAEQAAKGGRDAGAEAPADPLGGIPRQLPALQKAEKLQRKAADTGFDWPDWKGPLAKVREELAELEAEIPPAGPKDLPAPVRERLEEEFGDLLFATVNLARFLKVDPERALSRANRKFAGRYGRMRELAEKEGKAWGGMGLEEMDGYWEKAKKEEG